MLSLVVAALVISSGVLARKEPGPNDPDTYPLSFFDWESSEGEVIRQVLNETKVMLASRLSPSSVKIYYYRKNGSRDGVLIDLMNAVKSLGDTDFDKSERSTFVIHGFLNSHKSPACQVIKNALVKERSDNVFLVDWSSESFKTYALSRSVVPDVGRIVGSFINEISAGNGLNVSTLRLVGHSLGAHIAGFAGATLGHSKADEIVGLDPAWPLFSYNSPHERLSTRDAKYVQIIHTNGYRYGFPYSIGHVDYYPNGGEDQPGCFLGNGVCAHLRSFYYYEESLLSGNFVATKCDSYKDYKKGNCINNPTAIMGGYYTDKTVFGDYYLDTNSDVPYARGA